MGRSVNYHSRAARSAVFYMNFILPPEAEEDDGLRQLEWRDLMEDLKQQIQEQFPSFSEPWKKRYNGREVMIILENKHAEIGVSNYEDIISVSLATKDEYENDRMEALAKQWIAQVESSFHKKLEKSYSHSALNRSGNFSNGEAVFNKI